MNNKLFGRKEELELLTERFNSNRFEFGYLYGEKFIGKSSFVKMFCKSKKHLIFYAKDSEDIDIRLTFSETLNEAKKDIGFYDTWYDFFVELDNYVGDEKIVVVIEEYQNILIGRDGKRKKSVFDSYLQKAVDLLFKKRKFTLILTSSNVSFINGEIVDIRAPLFLRHTFSLKLFKLDLDEALLGYKEVKDNFEKAKFLSLTNTYPNYISLINAKKSFDENLDNLFFNRDAIIVNNTSKVIKSEISKGGLYASLIKYIASGLDTVKSLSEYFKMPSAKISKYLKELLNDEVIIKRKTFKKPKNVRYEIKDPMLAFYYRFIRDNEDLIKDGFGKKIKAKFKNEINDFISNEFKKLCLTYLDYLCKNLKLSGFFFEFENYHYSKINKKSARRIDFVSCDEDKLLIVSSKFSLDKKTIDDYYLLLSDLKAKDFAAYKTIELYIFSASSFTDELKNIKDEHLHLIDLEIMYNC